jgi:hypothetical protein
VDEQRLVVIPPSIDPFSAKNRELDPPAVGAVLAGPDGAGDVRWRRISARWPVIRGFLS